MAIYKYITGIDLGTTNSATAVLSEIGVPKIVPADDEQLLTPSLLYFAEDNTVEVGNAAAEHADGLTKDQAHRFVKEIKLKMEDPDHRTFIGDKAFSPAELSAKILTQTSSGVFNQYGDPGPVAISVPAYFKDIERRATKKAGELAELDVVSIVDEPIAAALAYFVGNEYFVGKCLVFDLGGGTCDVSVLSVVQNSIEVLATRGDSRLGGTDFDKCIFDWWRQVYMDETGEVLCSSNDVASEIRFLLEARETKHTLSWDNTKGVLLKSDTCEKQVRCDTSRQTFEKLIAADLARADMLLEGALEEAKLRANDVDVVLFAGGSTRIPAVIKMVEKKFNKNKIAKTRFVLDQIVAMGAAVHAGVFALKQPKKHFIPEVIETALQKHKIVEKVTHSFGVITEDKDGILVNRIILPKGTALLERKDYQLYTVFDDQRYARFPITQGEEADSNYMPDPIYTPKLDDLPGNRTKDKKLNVTMYCDADHILNCEFEDDESGISRHVKLEPSGSKGNTTEVPPDDLQGQ